MTSKFPATTSISATTPIQHHPSGQDAFASLDDESTLDPKEKN